jgi:hypothetical protein
MGGESVGLIQEIYKLVTEHSQRTTSKGDISNAQARLYIWRMRINLKDGLIMYQ